MDLIAWRTTGKNPSDDPPVYISIASKEPGTEVYPWVLPLAQAVEMFGEVVDQIGEHPVEVSLNLSFDKGTPSKTLP